MFCQEGRVLRAGILVGWLCVAVVAVVAVGRPSPTQFQPARSGVQTVQSPLADWKPIATFELGGDPDWLAISDNAVWVTNDKLKSVQRIDPRTNKLGSQNRIPHRTLLRPGVRLRQPLGTALRQTRYTSPRRSRHQPNRGHAPHRPRRQRRRHHRQRRLGLDDQRRKRHAPSH